LYCSSVEVGVADSLFMHFYQTEPTTTTTELQQHLTVGNTADKAKQLHREDIYILLFWR